ncbi:MAG TPA: branched-chain amino acid transporter AzlD, partial [Ruminococcaceae bacterium]|jgi:branched-subunit amino acid transport protein AzlD|nr:branched-chain amino acid transporter AzlD [Oscillospiraceae bacterium]
MYLTGTQTLIIILSVAAGAALTRFLPFLMFPDNRGVPPYIIDLGRMLPPAMMGLLVVYCLKDATVTASPFGIPELIAIAVIIVLHKWKNNVLLSIGGSTVVFMLLKQTVFS